MTTNGICAGDSVSMHGITLMTHLNGKLGLVNEVKAWDMVAVTMKEGGTVELFYCSNLKKEATSAPAAPASFGDFGAAASNGFMDKANRMFGCGRMFQSPPTFNEKPKFMSPGPKFGCGAAASNADRMLGAQGSLKHAPMEPTAPSVGARVKLHSLQKNPEHNGVEGEVVEPLHPVSGRWGVKIDSDGRVLALKPANLVLIRKHAQMVPAS